MLLSRVFQNIGECVLPRNKGVHTRQGEMEVGGQYFGRRET